MYKTVLLPLAKKDIREAAHWYNSQKKGLGKKFTKQIRKEIKFIEENPTANQTRYKSVKTTIVQIFPFMIHYQVDPINKLIIIAGVFHTSLNPKKWNKRP